MLEIILCHFQQFYFDTSMCTVRFCIIVGYFFVQNLQSSEFLVNGWHRIRFV